MATIALDHDGSNEEVEEREPGFHASKTEGIGGGESESNDEEIIPDGGGREREMSSNHHDISLTSAIAPKKQSSWGKIRRVVHNASHAARGLCPGSMTEAERSFLSMLNTSRAEAAPAERTSHISHFADAVDAAVSREKLRKELQARLSKLTSKEAQFLKDIVEDENVTKQQLENADRVLRTDKLYSLSEEDSDDDDHHHHHHRSREMPPGTTQDNLDVKVRCEESNVEVFLKGQNYSNMRPAPSTFTYKTWDLLKDPQPPTTTATMPMPLPILAMSEEIPQNNRVLSPPMMESLRHNLPPVIAEDHFWLKYSMARDGTSLVNLYNSVRQSTHTLLAIETTDGNVFGGFASSPWRENKYFYGSCEAFLWRLQSSRFTHCYSLEEQANLEKDIQVFDWSRKNRNIQMSNKMRIAMGGGIPGDDPDEDDDDDDASTSWGLGIALDSDLDRGTTNPCITFRSPPLVADASSGGTIFEVANMEVWAFSPCSTVELADQLEMGRMFVLSHFETS